jgi:hypothetical protein
MEIEQLAEVLEASRSRDSNEIKGLTNWKYWKQHVADEDLRRRLKVRRAPTSNASNPTRLGCVDPRFSDGEDAPPTLPLARRIAHTGPTSRSSPTKPIQWGNLEIAGGR